MTTSCRRGSRRAGRAASRPGDSQTALGVTVCHPPLAQPSSSSYTR